MTINAEQSQRWVWFIDVVFGAIVALGIQSYEPVVSEAWAQGLSEFVLTIVVGISIFSFVVYDIAVYHALVKKFPFGMTSLSFLRFYLDLVMAFTLYLLLANAFQLYPDWLSILVAVSFWHCAAVAWHLLARSEYKVVGGLSSAVLPHISFIAVYCLAAFLAAQIADKVFGLESTALSTSILIVVCLTILVVSLFRWNQIIKKVAV
ncbi:hypothetical protein [Allohahella sp. A8]|uniref:hypothetical protein n=1 Tax=Allohahella sp. A8 TaxID=3141461 RepID=UPI003A808647